jgi:iron transport multicopper oxidase
MVVHLHGHTFQALYRSAEGGGDWDPGKNYPVSANPLRRDVFLVPGNGFAWIAFRADNPGAWYVAHCSEILT